MRVVALLFWLIVVAAFGAGFAFDRWLHRPITAGGFTVRVARCYSDGSIPCPTAGGEGIEDCLINCLPSDEPGSGEPKIRPITGPCFFDPLLNQRCQEAI